MEDRYEQPGEDHRPPAGERYLCKLNSLQHHQSNVCVFASEFVDSVNRFQYNSELATHFFSFFFFQGAQILSAAKELGQLSKLKVSQCLHMFYNMLNSVLGLSFTIKSLTEREWIYFFVKPSHLFALHLDVQDHMAGEAKSLSPRQCAVMDVALDTIKVS